MVEPVLALQNITKNFGGLRVSDDVSLSVMPGEIHAVIGPNGAGKTTLIHQISGFLAPDTGRVFLGSRDITRLSPEARAKAGLSRSFQITSVLPAFSALENVAVAIQARSGSSFRFFQAARGEARLNDEARDILTQVGLESRLNTPASELSHGEKRTLEFAIALAMRPQVMLLDEPMAGAGHDEGLRIVALMQQLKGTIPMLLVEHDMEAVFALATRISVLVYGRIIASGTPDEIRANADVRSAYLGEDAAGMMLSVDDLQAGYGPAQVLFGLSLSVQAGEVVSLMGRNGMGKTTLIKAIMGLLPLKAGTVHFEGKSLTGAQPFRVAQAGIGLVPEGRQVFPTLTVEENLVATAANRNSSAHGKARFILSEIYQFFPRLQERKNNFGNQLSGGEQQMLAIGRALMTNPKLLILDEATEGLAPLIRAEIWAALAKLRHEGQSILVVDKHLDALLKLSNRHIVMEKGRVVWQGTSTELEANRVSVNRHLHV